MRSLLLSDYSGGPGGVERLTGNLRAELRSRGHVVPRFAYLRAVNSSTLYGDGVGRRSGGRV